MDDEIKQLIATIPDSCIDSVIALVELVRQKAFQDGYDVGHADAEQGI